MEVYATRLREAMERKNLTQQELSDKSGVDKTYISKYINGKYAPNAKNAKMLADILCVNPVWLMGIDVPMEMPTESYTVKLKELDTICKSFEERQLDRLLTYARFLTSDTEGK